MRRSVKTKNNNINLHKDMKIRNPHACTQKKGAEMNKKTEMEKHAHALEMEKLALRNVRRIKRLHQMGLLEVIGSYKISLDKATNTFTSSKVDDQPRPSKLRLMLARRLSRWLLR
jgi:hypothetical protein